MKYPFSVYQAHYEGHIFWVAKSSVLKGCVGQGDTQEEAMRELEDNEIEWLDTAQEVGVPIPEIPVEQPVEFSGKLTLRVSPSVHQKAAALAKIEGISLNQYINDAVIARNSELATLNYISNNVVNITRELNERLNVGRTRSEERKVINYPIIRPNSLYHYDGRS